MGLEIFKTCCKCGDRSNLPTYKKKWSKEWLEYECHCGYIWNENTLDNKQKEDTNNG